MHSGNKYARLGQSQETLVIAKTDRIKEPKSDPEPAECSPPGGGREGSGSPRAPTVTSRAENAEDFPRKPDKASNCEIGRQGPCDGASTRRTSISQKM